MVQSNTTSLETHPVMPMKASYVILEDTWDRILIQDRGVGMSITNDAEAVVQDLINKGLIHAKKVILYQDTENNVDRLVHDGIKFIAFGRGARS